MIPTARSLEIAYQTARQALLAERTPEGYWVGELSTSALSTAVAVIALTRVDVDSHADPIARGMAWLAEHQNADGGWGDTVKSFSNISTSMLCRAALAITGCEARYPQVLKQIESYLDSQCGRSSAERAEAIRARYGKDRTFSVPILMTCALARLVDWHEVPRLPFEMACLPQSWYRFVGLPVVSYALPALIAIGQCVHAHRSKWNPLTRLVRWVARSPSLKVLRRIQPSSGGYLEATPLTAFVTMSLASIGLKDHPVARDGVRFILDSIRPDGSWPIDTNLSIWVTTLSVNALTIADNTLPEWQNTMDWLTSQQTQTRHPYTGAASGAWGWSHCPGSVPDCDDTPGALLAIHQLLQMRPQNNMQRRIEYKPGDSPMFLRKFAYFYKNKDWVEFNLFRGMIWMADLQNRDGGIPTFCRGWGKLPFDRSGPDLTAHAIRALEINRRHIDGPLFDDSRIVAAAFRYLSAQQRPDGSWLPLWFGNQHAPDDINPVYGTARVLAAYRDTNRSQTSECQRGVRYLLSVQNPDGGWGGAASCPTSVEETAVALEVLLDLTDEAQRPAILKALTWLISAVESGGVLEPSPIGFYFAKLWYYEKLYPLIFTVAALGRAKKKAILQK